MDISYIKALHIIFVITWFAGLFYIVRLFIYHVEAEEKEEPARRILQTQYKIMSKRLWYIITWPSAVLASFFAFYMLVAEPSYLQMKWMYVKLSFVLVLYFYHFGCQKIYNQLQNDIIKYSSTKLRIWNEVATILLFAIVFIVVLKSSLNWIWGVVGIILFGIILMISIRLYKRIRGKKDWDNFEEQLLEDTENEAKTEDE
jgi:putative membrane protein